MTRSEQVVEHLRRIADMNNDRDVAPYGATANGIADALGITLCNAYLVLSRMDGTLVRSSRHVAAGSPVIFRRRVTTYRLPAQGGMYDGADTPASGDTGPHVPRAMRPAGSWLCKYGRVHTTSRACRQCRDESEREDESPPSVGGMAVGGEGVEA